jgi:hypothetical protein
MMMTEMDIETSVHYVQLTRLIAREDYIKFARRESTKTYVANCWVYNSHIRNMFSKNIICAKGTTYIPNCLFRGKKKGWMR